MDNLSERVKRAESRIEEYLFDIDAWGVVIRDAQTKKIDDARPTFERLLTHFPTCGRYWKVYIEQEMKSRNFDRVEKLFQRCLMRVLNIDLWKCYLSYVKETKGNLPTYREKMAQAYDFALEKIGNDLMSYQIWADYIVFLRSVDAVGSYAENQRITAVRKVYQRGCITPMLQIEVLWKDYIAYEQSINSVLAERIIMERSRDYMNARRVAKEHEATTRGLNRNATAVPPQNTPEDTKQTELWKKYITWEKANPTHTEDMVALTRRVMFAYEQCLLCMGHYPDIWYEAATYLEQSSKLLTEKGDVNGAKMFSDEAAAVYERATTTLLKKNFLIYFAFADYEEGRMRLEKCHSIYNKLIELQDIDPTLPYIQYMKFTRRAEGIKSARAVFKRAREDVRSNYHVFISAALMEYYCSKDKTVAFKIFELGLKKYSDNPDYLLAYIEYLSHLNEDNNTRVLFERVLTSGSLPPEKSVLIWKKFLEFESNIGDLASVIKVEKRQQAVFEKLEEFPGQDASLLVDRYKYYGLYPLSTAELKAIGYKDISTRSESASYGNKALRGLNGATDDNTASTNSKIIKPDVLQMIPFKPRQVYPTGSHVVAGGVFPPPPAAAALLAVLPPPVSFNGPFVNIEELIDRFNSAVIPEHFVPSENGVPVSDKLFETASLAASGNDSKKRPRVKVGGGGTPFEQGDSSDEEENGLGPPLTDIYRLRQHKRVK